MNKIKLSYLLVLALISVSLRAEEKIVARKDFNVSPKWQNKKFMDKDFWPLLKANLVTHSDLGKSDTYNTVSQNALFKECALTYVNYALPQNIVKEPICISKILRKDHQQAIDSQYKSNVPFFIRYCGTRHPFRLQDKYKHNTAVYKAWLQKHPNFIGFDQGEWDNEIIMMDYHIGKNKDQKEKLVFQKRFPCPTSREGSVKRAQKIHKNINNFYFNDQDKMVYMRAGWCFDHYAASWGANMLFLETTNTSAGDFYYRLQVSMFFTRGASRQFNIPWSWYIANFYNGYDSRGNWKNNYYHNFLTNKGIFGPDKGMSRSLFRRTYYLAYFAGASFIELENWLCLLLKREKSSNALSLSCFGEDFCKFYDFTKKLPDRGVAYAPVALLTPFSQGYPNWGGKAWSRYTYTRGDYMIDSFMYTIIPAFSKHKEMKKGVEGALFNSPYGDIYDVLTPDAPSQKSFTGALDAYKAAIMLGEYKTNKKMAVELITYVKNGGTLLINIKQLNNFFPTFFSGIKRTGKSGFAGNEIISVVDGQKFNLLEKYKIEKLKLAGAKVLLKDNNKNIIATVNKFGKGKVIVTSPDYLVPALEKNSVTSALQGKQFPFAKYFLSKIVEEVLPLAVEGDIEYGVNKIKKGYLLYLINNKGITKFVDTKQAINKNKRAKVKINFRKLRTLNVTDMLTGKFIKVDANNSIELFVEPGNLKVVKVQTGSN
jgi:hypothetical protein